MRRIFLYVTTFMVGAAIPVLCIAIFLCTVRFLPFSWFSQLFGCRDCFDIPAYTFEFDPFHPASCRVNGSALEITINVVSIFEAKYITVELDTGEQMLLTTRTSVVYLPQAIKVHTAYKTIPGTNTSKCPKAVIARLDPTGANEAIRYQLHPLNENPTILTPITVITQ